MLHDFLHAKKIAVVTSIGLAGLIGVCGCKSPKPRHECCAPQPAACDECGFVAVGPQTPEKAAPAQENAVPQEEATPAPAPMAERVPTQQPAPGYEEDAPSVEATVERFQALGGVAELDDFQELTLLDLSGTEVTDRDLQDGAGLSTLTQLDLSNTAIGDAAFAHPSWMESLTRLSLNNTQISNAALRQFRSLKQLQLLWLNETNVGDAGLQHLAGLTGLQSLGLNKTQVTNAGLAQLRNLKELRYLLLGNTQITDAGLQHLRGLKNLKGLSLVGTGVTPIGVAELQAALPGCQIVADPVKDIAEPQVEEGVDVEGPVELDSLEEDLLQEEPLSDPETFEPTSFEVRPTAGTGPSFAPLPQEQTPYFVQEELSTVEITRFYLGVALAETGDMRQAMPHFVKTVGPASAYYNIGVMLCKAGRWTQGESAFQAALELNPRLTAAKQWLSEIKRERQTVIQRSSHQTAAPANPQRPEQRRPYYSASQRRTDLTVPQIGVWTDYP